MSKTEQAIRWMEQHANDPRCGYDQTYRWGERGDYDCSSAVITAWESAGVKVKEAGASYTGNMYQAFKACGFKDVTKKVNRTNGAGMKRGDVLLNDRCHTAMFAGNYNIVQASINERGGVTNGTPGDQTGREFYKRSYYNYPWDHVLRFKEETGKKKPVRIPQGTHKKTPCCTGTCTADILNIRKQAVVTAPNIKNYPVIKKGDRVGICGQMPSLDGSIWYYVKIANKWYGFCSAKYIDID